MKATRRGFLGFVAGAPAAVAIAGTAGKQKATVAPKIRYAASVTSGPIMVSCIVGPGPFLRAVRT